MTLNGHSEPNRPKSLAIERENSGADIAAKMEMEENALLMKGLLDALVELYPDCPSTADHKFFAVLIQTQRVAEQLTTQVYQMNGFNPGSASDNKPMKKP